MSSKKFVKMDVYMFNSSKFKLIKCSERWYIVAAVWVSLLLEAGKTNDKGLIYLSKDIPYSFEMLSTIFDLELDDIKYSFDILQEYAMIDVREDGVIEIINWCEFQEPKAKSKRKVNTKPEVAEEIEGDSVTSSDVAGLDLKNTIRDSITEDKVNLPIEDSKTDCTDSLEETLSEESNLYEENKVCDSPSLVSENKNLLLSLNNGSNSISKSKNNRKSKSKKRRKVVAR